MKVFLGLEAGVTRGGVPEAEGASVPTLMRIGRRLAGKGREIVRRGPVQDSANPPILHGRPPVFFVVGQSRSGTTWLMTLLNSHPEILCMGEGRFFGRDWKEPGMRKRQVTKQPSSLSYALSGSDYLRLWLERSVWSREEDPDEHLDNLTRMAIDYFLARRLSKTGKRIVGDKTPLLAPGLVKEIGEIYPEAKVIHIIRDGRDQAVSLMHYLWNTARNEGGLYPVGPEELARRDAYRENPQKLLETGEGIFTGKRLRKMAENWSARVDKTVEDGLALLRDNYAEVRYEDLLARPQEEAGRLLRFLGAEADEKTVKRCVEAVSFEKRALGRKKGEEDPTSVGARKGVAGDWKDVFTERDKRIFKEVAGDVLIKVGYEKDNDW